MPRAALDPFSEYLVRFAQGALDKHGEFRPFAATVDKQGQLQYYAADDDAESSDFRAQIETLKRYLRQIAESGQIDVAGICFDVILHREDNPKQEAIQCSLEHADGEAIERFTPYSKSDSGAILYRESFTADRDREIFGFASLVLTLENQAPKRRPTLMQLESAVDSLTPRGGPGFLILDGAVQDYVQAAGGDGAFTVEWREYSKGEFRHWVAGLAEGSNENIVEIKTNDCVVTVRENEVLAREAVKSILAAFAHGKGRPAQYRWRDITARFVESSPGEIQE